VKSLRRNLLVSLWIAVSVLAIVSSAIAYVQVSKHAKQLLDSQLQQIATLVASQKAGKANTPDDSDIEVAIWDRNGTLQFSSMLQMTQQQRAESGFSEVILNAEPYRLYTGILDGERVAVAQPVDVRDDQAEAAALAALLPMLLLLPVVSIIIAFVIRTLLQPVKDVAAAVSRRETFAGDLLPSHGLPKEVIPLVDEINRLLARQNAAAQRERHFVEDAAHALRTPLTALQLQADILDGSTDPGERNARLADLREGIRRAARLSDQLLSLADAGSTLNPSGQTANVDDTLQDVQALYDPAASAAHVALDFTGHSNAKILGAPRGLILICSNLLDNALRYTQAGGRVELRTDAGQGKARIEVWDEGPGLPEGELKRVFERFYRVPGDASTGSGLGLATVQAVVRQLGGHISLHNRSDRSGLIARVILPCVELKSV
jgi:two-component system OmpR family sensor kinase